MTSPAVLITPRRRGLRSGADNTVDLLVRVQAPLPPDTASERVPLNLAIVLDRSGSMSGQPLDEAKRCAGMIIDRLGPRDRAALVVYDHRPAVLAPTTMVVDKTVFHAAIASIEVGGMTNLHGGWLKGAELMAPVARSTAVTRVLLLSDGQANEGVTDIETITRQCAELAGVGITTSTYGLGAGFNEDLMIRMANAGHGNSYYGETAEDLMDPFAEEFDLLAALCAKTIGVQVDTPSAVTVAVLNKFGRNPDGSFRLPDLAYGGESWAVIRLTVPTTHAGAGEGAPVTLGTIAISYTDNGGSLLKLAPIAVCLPSLAPEAFDAAAEDALVTQRVRELEAANIQDRAYRAARQGDWTEVSRLLLEARENAKDNEWLGKVVDHLERLADRADQAMFAKEAMYSSRKMRSRLAGICESASPTMPMASYLRRKTGQGKAAPAGEDA